jgi:hypothetical protein
VASAAARKMKIMQIFILKISSHFHGGDGFCSVCMRCPLWCSLPG